MANRINWKKQRREIPSRVQTGPRVWYEVCWIDSFADPDTYGETRPDTRQIVLKKGLSDKETVLTWGHELFHAGAFTHCIPLTESLVIGLENFFPYIIKPNNIFIKKKRK